MICEGDLILLEQKEKELLIDDNFQTTRQYMHDQEPCVPNVSKID